MMDKLREMETRLQSEHHGKRYAGHVNIIEGYSGIELYMSNEAR